MRSFYSLRPRTFFGIDPGVGRVGWAVITQEGPKLKAIRYGCVETKRGQARLITIQKRLAKILKAVKPDVVAVEQLFFAKNVKTALRVSEARGVIVAVIEDFRLPMLEPTPLQVKKIVCGAGNASKKDVEIATKRALAITKSIKPDDAVDALAIAIWAAYQKIL